MPKKLTEGISKAIDNQYKKFVKTLSSNAIDAHIGGDVAAHKIMNIEVNWDQVDKEAVKYASNYGRKLSKSGMISIPKTIVKDGVEVFGGYEDYDLIGKNKIADKKEISRIIREGLKAGKPTGYKQEKNGHYPKGSIAYELDKYFNARKSHASLVARTEIARIEGVAMKNRYKKVGYNFAEWNTMNDDDVRPEHMERQEHGIYPIDEIPDIGEPNCRCVIIPVTDEKAKAAGFEVEDISEEPVYSPMREPRAVTKSNIVYPMYNSEYEQSDKYKTNLEKLGQKYGISPKEYEKKVSGLLSEVIDQSELGVRISGGNLLKVIESKRFKSQFEIRNSGGMFNPEYRAELEEKLFKADPNLDPKLRPIYGMLIDDSAVRAGYGDWYGSFIAVMKKDRIKSRTSFCVGDSLDNSYKNSYKPSLITDPSPISGSISGGGDDVPMLESVKSAGLAKFGTYVEIQIHGGVTIDDIDHIKVPWHMELDPKINKIKDAGLNVQIIPRGSV
jgi:SPP1 gp7 family putative phage head morphogenesis protein